MCVGPQHHSHELAGPQLQRGGREKTALSGEKNRTAQSQTATEAPTGHTSPFKPNGEATLQETSLPPRRKCVHSSKATRVLGTCIHCCTKHCTHEEKSSPEDSHFRTQKATPRHPEQGLPEAGTRRNNVPDSKCELREHRGQENTMKFFQRSRRLTHDEGIVPASPRLP